MADIVARPQEGGGSYILAVLQRLHEAGFELEYICTRSPAGRTPWFRFDRSLTRIARLHVCGNISFASLCVRLWPVSDWIHAFAVRVYLAMPVMVRNRLRKQRTTDNTADKTLPRPLRRITASELEFAAAEILRTKPQVVIVNRVSMADLLDRVPRETRKVVLTHDIWSNLSASFRARGEAAPFGDWDRATESQLLSKAELLVAIQAEETEELRQMAPGVEVVTVPMPVAIRECRGETVRGRCLFVGSDELHNVNGLNWFLHEVWPKVRAKLPGAEVHVCGDVCVNYRERIEGVHFQGRVSDLNPEYSAAEVCVVPLHIGSGLKIKLVEALAYGRACVATTCGLQGLMSLAGHTVTRADEPDAFANAMCDLFDNPSRRHAMEQGAKKFVKENLSPSVACQPLVDAIQRRMSDE